MSEPENFLDRWSRRKRGETNEEDKKLETAALPPETGAVAPDVPASDKSTADRKPSGDEEPAFDLSKLPSIDSITAATDIRMFMLPGVPMALRQAALRKVWVTDPKIRDFIEMAENQWDFTADMPGFDFSPPTGDVKKMVAEIFGKSHEEKEAELKAASAEEKPVSIAADVEKPTETSTEQSVRLSGPEERKLIPENPPATEPEPVGLEDPANVASQNIDATQNEIVQEIPKRRHGSALPG